MRNHHGGGRLAIELSPESSGWAHQMTLPGRSPPTPVRWRIVGSTHETRHYRISGVRYKCRVAMKRLYILASLSLKGPVPQPDDPVGSLLQPHTPPGPALGISARQGNSCGTWTRFGRLCGSGGRRVSCANKDAQKFLSKILEPVGALGVEILASGLGPTRSLDGVQWSPSLSRTVLLTPLVRPPRVVGLL